jgi:hypothetical protein
MTVKEPTGTLLNICMECADLDYLSGKILDTSITYIENNTKAKYCVYPNTTVNVTPIRPLSSQLDLLPSEFCQ